MAMSQHPWNANAKEDWQTPCKETGNENGRQSGVRDQV
jgi:hypothetical protein